MTHTIPRANLPFEKLSLCGMQLLLEQTSKQRRRWIQNDSPPVKEVLDIFPCFADPRIVNNSYFRQSCGPVHPYLYIANDKCVLPVEWTAEGGNECQVVKLPNPPLQVRTFGAQKSSKSNCPRYRDNRLC